MGKKPYIQPAIEFPKCVFCGKNQDAKIMIEYEIYTVALFCRGCDAHGPVAMDADKVKAIWRAIRLYNRAVNVREILLDACRKAQEFLWSADIQYNEKSKDVLATLECAIQNVDLRVARWKREVG